ncbi:hypothetical protein O6H91_06G074100 [Diphasiastrum complanatum]|uniref:Uncharacterized protein n=2 Tax=Diphasiastrum complanatum TaxID=34168 RepID=A0ACC2DF41_DIPCM|nr:hypothetical protein O6H91_06G074100 [Diphasiastrum complanatum]KAJ7552881.1 hypothetical protein O6H91_06G074100 [Diphasiastrum complanatum]
MASEREMGELSRAPSICERMRLWEFPNQYVFEPLDGAPHQTLAIDRTDGELSSIGELPISNNEQSMVNTIIFGLVGVIRLLAGSYVLVITSKDYAGTYYGSPVFRISSMKFLSCNSSVKELNAQQKRDEAHFTSLLKTVERTPGLYFSYDMDLTLSTQRSYDLLKVRKLRPLWKQADPTYFWNKHLLEELIENKLDAYILPVVQGSFQSIGESIKGKPITLTLISRRCTRRIGTRMWRRGADREGYAANFVETEQILEESGFVASYVQVRGSIPLAWEQIVDLTYKPKIKIHHVDELTKIVERHFRDLSQRYGSILVLDLINQHGSEGELSVAYGNAMQSLSNDHIRYVPFDFHRICGNIHFERLSFLYDQIAEDLRLQGFFLMNSLGERVAEQRGVVRTNCIDCLDRTNVTQSLLGRKCLETQLQQLGVFESSETIAQNSSFDEKFKNLWANNGDEISIQYSGTPALKSDFVRYGTRTTLGLVRDGFNALSRYFLNNFYDGIRQDAMDLVAGHYSVSRNKPSPFPVNGFETLSYLPVASATIVAGLTLTKFTLSQAGQDLYHFFYSVIGAGITAGVVALVKRNGRQFCNRPCLCGLF